MRVPVELVGLCSWLLEGCKYNKDRARKQNLKNLRMCLVPLFWNFEKESFYTYIKYGLITKLITELVCKLQAASNEPN